MRNALARAVRQVPPIARLVQQRDSLARQTRSLRRQLAATQSEARRLRRGTVDDEGLGYLFVVTYGRSGSTLLQGVLNSIPGYLIRGENGGVLRQLFEFHHEAVRRRDEHGEMARRRGPRSPWFGIDGYRDEVALRSIRQLALTTVLRPRRGTRVVGFKEVRWAKEDVAELIGFLRQVFPGARFVFNTRELDAVAQSKWWTNYSDAKERLTAIEERLLKICDELGDEAYHVRFDDYVTDATRLRGLFEWLGEDFDPGRLAAVLTKKHSY